MSNKNEDIGKVFRDVVEGFDEDLPTRVWDNVNNELKKDKQRKKVIVYFSIAASVALIIAFSSGYFMALNNSKHPYYSKINKELNTKPLTNASDNKKDLKNNNNPEINILQKNNHKKSKKQ